MTSRSSLVLAIGVVVVVLAAAVYLTAGFAGLSTRTAPSRMERAAALVARRLATPARAKRAVNPVPFSPDVWAESRAHFADHCATCHGNDGRGQTEMGRLLYPPAPDMRLPATQQLTDGELYYIIENGVRLTGMPAWGRGGDNDIDTWKLVHFVRHLSDLTPEQLKEMESLNPKSPAELKEEQDDQRFLQGDDVPAGAAEPAPHHHHEEER